MSHRFLPYVEYPHLCCAERPEDGDTCNRPREDHGDDLTPTGEICDTDKATEEKEF